MFNKNGFDDTLNITRVNLMINGFSTALSNSLVHKNLNMSQSFSSTATIRKAFSMSPARATRCSRKRSKISKIDWPKLGPVYRQLLSKGLVDLAEAIDYSQF